MTTIENDLLKVTIRPQGAELVSVYNKALQLEQLWNGNADIWPWHAPNLFPIVGGVVNNSIKVDGQLYTLTRHGFTRETIFEAINVTDTHATFALRYNDQTLAVYPYKFEFHIIYDLVADGLKVTYQVINLDDKDLYFQVGAHPAFVAPFYENESYDDYDLEFELDEPLERHNFSKNGLFDGTTEPVVLENKKLRLTNNLFDRDAIVFKNIQSKVITLRSDKHDKFLAVSYPAFKHMGIWAKPGAPFVCIEPWLGLGDTEGDVVDFTTEKEAMEVLPAGQQFAASFVVGVSK